MPRPMAEAFTLPDGWVPDLALATPSPSERDPAGLSRLPEEWLTVDGVVLGGLDIDHVVIGPNGVFTISIDKDPAPATIETDGLYRDGSRVTESVKNALMAAHDLRGRLGEFTLAYPFLMTSIAGPSARLDRLGIVPGGRIPEAIWNHAGVPLTRSERTAAAWAIRSLVQ